MKDFDEACLGLWSFGQGDEREKQFEVNMKDFKETVRQVIEYHRERKNVGEYDVAPFLDSALDNIDDEDELVHQVITFMVGGFHTTGMFLTWILYFTAIHQEVQAKMRSEIFSVLGS